LNILNKKTKIMKTQLQNHLVKLCLIIWLITANSLPFFAKENVLAPTVTISTETRSATNVLTGTGDVVYIFKLTSTEAFALNNISIALSGTFANTDVSLIYLRKGANPNPNIGITSLVGYAAVVGNGGNAVFNNSVSIAANTDTYFYLYTDISTNAVPSRTIKVIGGNNPNPVTLSSTASTIFLVNNQTDIAGGLTIIKPTITLSTEAVPTSNFALGATKNVYILKIVNDYAFNLSNIKAKFTGSFLAGDLAGISYELRNSLNAAEVPSYQTTQTATTFTNGNTNTVNLSWFIAANSTKFLYIKVTAGASAIAGRTIKIDGALDPVLINDNSTSIIKVNNQTDIAGEQTIVLPDITVSSIATTTETVIQNQTYLLAKILVNSTSGINLRGLKIPFIGSADATDLSMADFHVSASTSATAIFGTDVGYNYFLANGIINTASTINYFVPANTAIYLNITVRISPSAVKDHTIKIGSALEFLSPSNFTLTDNQTDVFGEKTIFAPTLIITNILIPNSTVKPSNPATLYQLKLNSDADFTFNSLSVDISDITADKISNISIGGSSETFTLTQVGNKVKAKINISNMGVSKTSGRTITLSITPSGTLPDNYKIKMICPSNAIDVISNFTKPILINNQTSATTELLVLGTMPTTNISTSFGTIDANKKTAYYNGFIVASISAPQNIPGGTLFNVWPTGGNYLGYVPRHYEINPPAASSGASATVTLYFTQDEFDNFNTNDISYSDIPTGQSDLQGKANLRIFKFAGASTAGSNGITYASNTPLEINPDDNKIVWNSIANRWEITFDITGFSGFFVGSAATPLPVSLISFSGKNQENSIQLNWHTSTETNFSHFEIQKSSTNKEFGTIGKVTGNQSAIYNFTDTNPTEGQNYYKLKMVDLDGTSSFSKTIALNFEKNGYYLSVENPVKEGEFTVRSNYESPKFSMVNSLGKKIEIFDRKRDDNLYKISIKNITTGLYFLLTESKGKIITRKILIE
jgi:Secretion system C-terminal sorting domain